MKKLRIVFVWWFMLTKRLFRQWAYALIILSVPVLALALSAVSSEESGILSIALGRDAEDPLSEEIIQSFMKDEGLVNFIDCGRAEDALDTLYKGDADAAWIFPEDFSSSPDDFVYGKLSDEGKVRIYQREENVLLGFIHEKLYGRLYGYCSEAMYINFVRENVAELDGMSDDELMEYYDAVNPKGEIFDFVSSADVKAEEKGYLIAPLRGLFALIILLCGISLTMAYGKDERNGTFTWIPGNFKTVFSYIYKAQALFYVAAAVIIALCLSGIALPPGRELLMMVLYVMQCLVFLDLLKIVFGDGSLLAAISPVLMIGLTAVCPVFFNIKSLYPLQLCLPPYYYLSSAYDDAYLWRMVLYTVVLFAVNMLTVKLKYVLRQKKN
ncbi:MAG: hypothetical protein E7623_01385 [Ruminococcaceae bacterium]|nr:hypothetical protein [Oscillospiraceae bacterium]